MESGEVICVSWCLAHSSAPWMLVFICKNEPYLGLGQEFVCSDTRTHSEGEGGIGKAGGHQDVTMSRWQGVAGAQPHWGSVTDGVGYILELSQQGTRKLGYSWRNHGDLFKALMNFIIVILYVATHLSREGGREKLLCIIPLGFLYFPFVLCLGCHCTAYHPQTQWKINNEHLFSSCN